MKQLPKLGFAQASVNSASPYVNDGLDQEMPIGIMFGRRGVPADQGLAALGDDERLRNVLDFVHGLRPSDAGRARAARPR